MAKKMTPKQLERFRKQSPPKTYRYAQKENVVSQPPVFVPSRPVMKDKITQETIKSVTVQQDLKGMSRKEKRRTIREIVKGAVSNIRDKMIKEMEQFKSQG